ncbi:MAG TPA: two-component system activity regulator YycH [Bacillales bacterium]|nr:two-component system activity regulator YycH [Bacillales bacterium]
MKWESFKTLLLTVLVILSLVLTWNLWTYQSDYNTIEKPDYITSVLVSKGKGKSTIGEIIHPFQAIYHADDQIYGLSTGQDLHDMFQTLIDAEFRNIFVFSNELPDKLKRNRRQEPDSNGVEIIFPKAIPVSLFGEMLQGDGSDKENMQDDFQDIDSDTVFDRIVFYNVDKDQNTSMKAYFKERESTVASADVNNVSLADLKSYYEDKHIFLAKNLDDKTIYLPAEPKPKKLLFNKSWISEEKFINALFSYPNVRQEQENVYKSVSEFLRVNNHIIKYFNADPGSGKVKTNLSAKKNPSLLQESFQVINSHSGWTHDYMLFDYKNVEQKDNPLLNGTAIFRLMVGNSSSEYRYPVFSDVSGYGYYPYNDAGTILLSWKNGEVHELVRTQLYIKENLPQPGQSNFKTGEEIWETLNTSEEVQMNFVKDIRVGYEMTYPPDPNLVFTPKWFVLYNGEWVSADKLTTPKEKVQEGNEQ